ncbi:MAG: LL-diaminopimelate aminotransferase [Candidatus Dadabacteria bacterium]|nr:LL-diaminopimelate aminotransferase [Candidatus Dadabacteria bacterium]
MRWARRIDELPPYLFAEIDAKKEELIKKGVDVIDLGVGDPDLPTPEHIINALERAANDPANHRYPSYVGMLSFREAAARWMRRRFGVDLDPGSEVLALIGSKEGVAHIPLAFIDPGDVVLVPDPGYPVYPVSTTFAGGVPWLMPLYKENGFLPDLSAIPADIRKKAKLMFLNYPNNPTTAVTGNDFFDDVVEFAAANDIIVCHDAAYTEIAYDGLRPPSFLEVDGAMEVGMELHSHSKTYNMTGWRIAFAVGNKRAIGGLGKVKTNIDSGAFQAVQAAAIEALDNYTLGLAERVGIYQERRDIFCRGLDEAGIKYHHTEATFYVWIEAPSGYSSQQFANTLLTQSAIVVTPGEGFGKYGEGYVRVTLTIATDRLTEAVERIKDVTL